MTLALSVAALAWQWQKGSPTEQENFALIGYNFHYKGNKVSGVKIIGDKIFYISEVTPSILRAFKLTDDAVYYLQSNTPNSG